MGTSSRYSLSLPDTIRLRSHAEGGMSLACPGPAAPTTVLEGNRPQQSCHLIGGDRSSLREVAFLWNCLSQSFWHVCGGPSCSGRPGRGRRNNNCPCRVQADLPQPGLGGGISHSNSLLDARFVFPLRETVWELLRPEAPQNRKSLPLCSSHT